MTIDGKELFERAYSLVVGPSRGVGAIGAIDGSLGLDVSNLRCVFKVKKSLKPEPNTAEIKVYGLAESSRRILESAEKLVVRLEAGYRDTGTSQIFLGEVRTAYTQWEGPDCITTITTGDSEQEMQEARLHMTVGPSVPVETVLSAICKSLNVGDGNVAQAAAMLRAKGVAAMFGPGTAISGQAARQLTDFCRSGGLEWSIQDGRLQILDANKPLLGKSVLISPSTGLRGSPAIDFSASSKTKKGGMTVKLKVSMIPGLAPGKLVVLQSRSISGGFRIEEAQYEGDTHGDDWQVSLTCRSY